MVQGQSTLVIRSLGFDFGIPDQHKHSPPLQEQRMASTPHPSPLLSEEREPELPSQRQHQRIVGGA